MDINLDKIKEIFKRKKVFRKEGMPINPNLYWRYLLAFVVVVIAASIVFSIYIYKQVINEELFSPTTNSERSKTHQRDRILEMVEYFDERATRSEKIKNESAPVVDPSI